MQTGTGRSVKNGSALTDVVSRNIDALVRHQQQEDMVRPRRERLVKVITDFIGSFMFVLLHLFMFGTWMALNSSTVIKPWDPFPFPLLSVLLAMEVILLTSFILMGQDRILRAAQRRADLDLQINLLAEHEVTRLLILVDGIAAHLGLHIANDPDVEELKKNVEPRTVLTELRRAEGEDDPATSADETR